MGIYLYKVSCTACPFDGMARYGPSASSYLLEGDVTADLTSAAAWCRRCLTVVEAEKLPLIASIEAEIVALETPGQARDAFFADAADFAIPVEMILEMHLDSLRACAAWRSARRSRARCLSCGSHDFSYLQGGDSEPFAPMPHPSCQGTLRFTDYAHAVPSRQLYSVEGELLDP